VTAPFTADQGFDYMREVVREAVYIDFGEEHLEHGDTIDLKVGLCDDPVMEGGKAML
jgi:hypothetical protein